METLNLPRMGNLLNARAGMGYSPGRFIPSTAVPVPIPASRNPAPPPSARALTEYASMQLDGATSGTSKIMTRQQRRDLLLSQMARHEIQFSEKFGPQFLKQSPPSSLSPSSPSPTRIEPILVAQGSTPRSLTTTPAVPTPTPVTTERSAASIATHTAAAKASMLDSKMPRFVVDNQETIAAKSQQGSRRVPCVATIDLPAALSAAATTDADSMHRIKESKEDERPGKRRRLRSPASVSSKVSSRSSLSPSGVTKKRHTRGLSSSSVAPSVPASTSSLDAITSYIASMSESERVSPVPSSQRGWRTARHVSFNVNANGTQGFTIRGNGTEQRYEIGGCAPLFNAITHPAGGAQPCDDARHWASLIYGQRASARAVRDGRQMLPPLAEVAELQAARGACASLDLPPIRRGGVMGPTRGTLATMQPRPTQRALSLNSSLSPTLAQMVARRMSEEDAVLEEQIRGLEAMIRSGGARHSVAAEGASVVLIPPEMAARVGSLLGVILRRQYCKLRRAAEAAEAEAADAGGAVEGGHSLPSIAEVFGRRTQPKRKANGNEYANILARSG